MRWIVPLALCALCSSAPCWAESPSSPSTEPSPGASAQGSPSASATWERLDELLAELETDAESSSADSRRLEASLRDARRELTELSGMLDESATRASELSSSLASCEASLARSEESLKEARARAGTSELELRIWRGVAFLSLAACAGCAVALLAR